MLLHAKLMTVVCSTMMIKTLAISLCLAPRSPLCAKASVLGGFASLAKRWVWQNLPQWRRRLLVEGKLEVAAETASAGSFRQVASRGKGSATLYGTCTSSESTIAERESSVTLIRDGLSALQTQAANF